MIHISENFIIDGYNNRTILRDTIKEKILSQSHYSPLRDVMLEANFLSEQPRRATGDGGEENEDWVYNKKTNKYEWDKDVKSSDDIKDKSKYDYVGVKRSDIYKHWKNQTSWTEREFGDGPQVNFSSFYQYLSNEFYGNVRKLYETKKDINLIENIRGFKENVSYDTNGEFSFPLYLGNEVIGILAYYKFPNLFGKNQYIVKAFMNSRSYKYPYQIYIYNRRAWNMNFESEGKVPSISIFLKKSLYSESMYYFFHNVEFKVSPPKSDLSPRKYLK